MSNQESTVHQAGTSDGWHGVIKTGGEFPPEKGRYHLYIGLFCPFAHRVNFVRHLKGLADFIDISVVRPFPKGDPGWKFSETGDEYPCSTVDKVYGSEYLHDLYFKADKDYKGHYSIPVLWDKQANTIVNNDSAEMLRWLPTAFNSILPSSLAQMDLYPQQLQAEIDTISAWVQRDFNMGVYHAGMASSQEEYEKNVVIVFGALNKLEEIAAKNGGPFILGKEITELDIRVYTTLVRFDVVYVQHFKCNLGTIRHNYPVLHNWLKHMYWNVPASKPSTNFEHIKENYIKTFSDLNPKGIVPMGPVPDVEEGVEPDFGRLQPGGIKLPAVLDYQSTLP